MAVENAVEVFPDYLLIRSKGAIGTGDEILKRIRGVLDLARSHERYTLLVDEDRKSTRLNSSH